MSLIARSHLLNQRDPLAIFEDVFGDVFTRPRYALGDASLTSRARMDLVEKPEAFDVRIDLPGVAKEDIKVDIHGNRVSISAQTKSEKEQKEGDRVLYSERYAASYARSFELPQEVDEAQAVATYENGVLKLLLPKKALSASKRLAIR